MILIVANKLCYILVREKKSKDICCTYVWVRMYGYLYFFIVSMNRKPDGMWWSPFSRVKSIDWCHWQPTAPLEVTQLSCLSWLLAGFSSSWAVHPRVSDSHDLLARASLGSCPLALYVAISRHAPPVVLQTILRKCIGITVEAQVYSLVQNWRLSIPIPFL